MRWNLQVHQTTREVPIISLQKEKDSLLPLPHEKIRNHYKITTLQVKVNKQAMISYKSNQYSVSNFIFNFWFWNIRRFIIYVWNKYMEMLHIFIEFPLFNEKWLYTKSGAWKNSSPGFQFLYTKRQISNIIKV